MQKGLMEARTMVRSVTKEATSINAPSGPLEAFAMEAAKIERR
jgi:hypothetical protein